MAEEPFIDKPTAELSLDKDQADCLLIVLTQHEKLLRHKLKTFSMDDQVDLLKPHYPDTDIEEIRTIIREQQALDHSLVLTIPGILEEIKEMYPYLQEVSDKSKIIIPKPIWEKKN